MNQQDLNTWMTLLIAFFKEPINLWFSAGVAGATITILIVWALSKKKEGKRQAAIKDGSAAKASSALSAETRASAPLEKKPPSAVEEIQALDQKSWLSRLRQGLNKTRSALHANLEGIFSGKGTLDESTLEQLHETLFRSDIGFTTADKLVEHVRQGLKADDEKGWPQVQKHLHDKSLELIGEVPSHLNYPEKGPLIILVVGVNGAGKTTTIGKLTAQFLAENKSVLLCAADTFRAAAIDQLKVWGERLGVKVIAHQQGSDPAAVAYDGVKAAISRQYDVLLIDTAGRLHSKSDLMSELNKINRVIGKDLPGAPHETWLVVDATTGQNAFQQVKAFKEVVAVTGIIVTKLDGTAKGGVIIGISDQFKLPIRYIGVGEKASDLRPFLPTEYVDSLFS